MSKYSHNEYKFHTEEWFKGKKTNNSGVWMKGDEEVIVTVCLGYLRARV